MLTELDWAPDVLPGHVAASIALAPSDDGELAATIVRRGTTRHRQAVLYVHGYADYYFQSHLADAWDAAGFDFYAVDLRRYGRSLRDGNRANYVDSLDDYFDELDVAVAEAAREHDRLVLLGHSTGGLIAALYADRGGQRGAFDQLVLNSPWLDIDLPFTQTVMWRIVARIGHLIPHQEVAAGDSFYVDSIHRDFRGDWGFDLEWKPKVGAPIHPGWTRAIALGHREVHSGLEISVPILVQHSDKSMTNDTWSDELLRSDSVLNVDQIHRRAPFLGAEVTIQTIENGMHDLWLSAKPVRDEVARRTFDWLDQI